MPKPRIKSRSWGFPGVLGCYRVQVRGPESAWHFGSENSIANLGVFWRAGGLAGWGAGALGRWIAAEFLAMQIAISMTADTGVCGAFEVPTRRIASGSK